MMETELCGVQQCATEAVEIPGIVYPRLPRPPPSVVCGHNTDGNAHNACAADGSGDVAERPHSQDTVDAAKVALMILNNLALPLQLAGTAVTTVLATYKAPAAAAKEAELKRARAECGRDRYLHRCASPLT